MTFESTWTSHIRGICCKKTSNCVVFLYKLTIFSYLKWKNSEREFQALAATGVTTKPSVVARRLRAAPLRANCCSSSVARSCAAAKRKTFQATSLAISRVTGIETSVRPMTAIGQMVSMTGPGRQRVPDLTKWSPHSRPSVPGCQRLLSRRQIGNCWDRSRCTGEVDLTLKQSLILEVQPVVEVQLTDIFVANAAHHWSCSTGHQIRWWRFNLLSRILNRRGALGVQSLNSLNSINTSHFHFFFTR